MSGVRCQKKEKESQKPNGFFIGLVNGILLSLPIWGLVAYIVWRW